MALPAITVPTMQRPVITPPTPDTATPNDDYCVDIISATYSELVAAAKAMEKDILENWKPEYGDKQKQDQEIKNWNERHFNGISLLCILKEATPEYFEQRQALVAKVGETPVGILYMNFFSSTPYIQDIVTHPGSSGVGCMLMEKAVNESYQHKQQGILKLFPLDETCEKVYEKMGFVMMDDRTYMLLEPAKSDAWWFDSGQDRYHLKQDISTK